MSDDRNHTIATATVTSEETPYGVRINTGGHALRADEPADRGGADTGPAPFGLLLASVDVELTYVVEDRDTGWIDRLITLHGVDEDQRAKLADVAEKTPVTRAIHCATITPAYSRMKAASSDRSGLLSRRKRNSSQPRM